MLKTAILVVLYIACGAVGNLLVGWGMKVQPTSMPHVASGTIILALGYAVYLGLLKELPLSVVVPVGAASYLLMALLSRICLHEVVPTSRWVGAIIVSIGVSVVMLSDQQLRQKAGASDSEPATGRLTASRSLTLSLDAAQT